MKLIKRQILTLLSLCIPAILSAQTPLSAPSAQTNSLALLYSLQGDVEKQYTQFVEEKIAKIGFNVTNPHHRVNDQYEAKWGSTQLDLLSFLSVTNDKNLLPLMIKDPRISSFAPFNMLIYKMKGEKTSYVGHLMPNTMLDLIGIEDKAMRDAFVASFKPLDEMLDKEFSDPKFKAKKTNLSFNKMAQKRMIQFEYTFERPEDIDDFIEEFQNKFELAFIDKGYLIAGYHNFKDDDEDDILEDFDAFWTYSLCHLEFSYNMFDNDGSRPEAGLFAPCTMYIYIKADSNTLVFGMPTLSNWMDMLNITDEKRRAIANKLEQEIPQILSEYGMTEIKNVNPLTATAEEKKLTDIAPTKAPVATQNTQSNHSKQDTNIQTIHYNGKTVDIVLPTVPQVPTPITVTTNGKSANNILDRGIKFSKRIPPDWDPNKYNQTKEVATQEGIIGDVTAGRISAHLRGTYIEPAEVEKKLKDAGFQIVGTSVLDKKKTLTTIVFTNNTLIDIAAKKNRGFISSLRVLVDSKDKRISITNPLYLTKAFLQDDFNEEAAKKLLTDLNKAFTGLRNSEDALKFQLLPAYQFMKGLPKYQDMEVVASGNDLEAKLKGNKKVLFTQKLPNGAILAGVVLSPRTGKFINKIGTNNAALLPYPVLIENGEAKILDPKYYIAIMYPMLKMSEFMTIATIPDAISKDCQRVFR